MISRGVFLARMLGACALAGACAFASAQQPAFPSKPVSIIVPYPPGGITDVLGRLLAEGAARKWGRPVVVENVPGGGTTIGTQKAATAPPDGHTILITSFGFVINQIMMKSLPYDSRALLPVSLVGLAPNVLYLHPSVPVTSVAELVAYAKANPERLVFASSGNLSSPHFAAELFANLTGSRIVHTPYRGTSPAMADVLGGQVSGIFDTLQSMSYARSGKLRVIASASDKRLSGAPELPTFAESGLSGMLISSWFGLLLPAGTPEAVRQYWSATLREIIAQPEASARILQNGVEPANLDPQGFQAFLDDELRRWSALIKARNLKLD